MFQLNQKYKDKAQRTFEYELPDFLAKDGPCFLKVKVKPFSECERSIKLTSERLLTNIKAQSKVLEDRMTAKLAGVPDIYDMSDPIVEEARNTQAEGDMLAQNQFYRDLTIGIIENCVIDWETNIYDNESKGSVAPTTENFMALAAMAFPESAISEVPDVAAALQKMREDVLDGEGAEQAAKDKVRAEAEKN